MDPVLFNFLFFGALFVIVFLIDYCFINLRKYKIIFGNKKSKKKDKKITFGEVDYLIGKFKLDKQKINYKAVIVYVSLINAFIISFVATVINLVPTHIVWQLLIGFVLLFALIYSLYEIFGRILVRKGWVKSESSRNRK